MANKRRHKIIRTDDFDKREGIGIKYILDNLIGHRHVIYIKSIDRDTFEIEEHPCYIKKAWMNDSGRWKVKYQLLDDIQGEYPGLVTEVFDWDGSSKSNKGRGHFRYFKL